MLIWKLNKTLLLITIFLLSLIVGTKVNFPNLANIQNEFKVNASILSVQKSSQNSRINTVLGIADKNKDVNSSDLTKFSSSSSDMKINSEFRLSNKNQITQISNRLKKLNFSANSVLVFDENNTQIFEKNTNSKLAIASITKLATVLTALKFDQDLNSNFQVDQEISTLPETKAGLIIGEKYKYQDLISSSLIYSANDSALVLAKNIENKYNVKFVDEMNYFARSIGMNDTKFANPTGLDDQNSYSTAKDVAKLVKFAYQNEIVKNLVSMQTYDFSSNSGKQIHIVNTNQLLLKYSFVTGMKTGTTLNAGECLVLSLTKNGIAYFVIILGSSDRYKDAEEVLKVIN